MRIILFVFIIAAHAWAQQDSPMVVIGGDAKPRPRPASEVENERVLNQFPEWAVTRAGAATGGYDQDVPATPSNPPSPAAAPAPQTAAAQSPSSPQPPASPASKLWPVDTVPIFMRSCVGYQPKLIIPCKCVIGRLMTEMPHDEFLKLTVEGSIENDQRLQRIRTQCAINSGPGE